MEQEETKTTAAAGVEMPPEAESWVQLHESLKSFRINKTLKPQIRFSPSRYLLTIEDC